MEEIILQTKDGKILASSRDIADKFEKAHKSILESIRNLIKNNPELSTHFIKTTYKSSRNRIYPCYQIDNIGNKLLEEKFKYNIQSARFEYKLLK